MPLEREEKEKVRRVREQTAGNWCKWCQTSADWRPKVVAGWGDTRRLTISDARAGILRDGHYRRRVGPRGDSYHCQLPLGHTDQVKMAVGKDTRRVEE